MAQNQPIYYCRDPIIVDENDYVWRNEIGFIKVDEVFSQVLDFDAVEDNNLRRRRYIAQDTKPISNSP